MHPGGSSIAQRHESHVTLCALEDTGSLIFNIVVADMFSTSFFFLFFPT